MSAVRFTVDDPAGLWRKGEVAEDLGWESGQLLKENDPDFLPIRVLRLATGEVITLTVGPTRRWAPFVHGCAWCIGAATGGDWCPHHDERRRS